jgi:hypothetical protein
MVFSCGEYLSHGRIWVAFFKEIGILVFLFQRQCVGDDPSDAYGISVLSWGVLLRGCRGRRGHAIEDVAHDFLAERNHEKLGEFGMILGAGNSLERRDHGQEAHAAYITRDALRLRLLLGGDTKIGERNITLVQRLDRLRACLVDDRNQLAIEASPPADWTTS